MQMKSSDRLAVRGWSPEAGEWLDCCDANHCLNKLFQLICIAVLLILLFLSLISWLLVLPSSGHTLIFFYCIKIIRSALMLLQWSGFYNWLPHNYHLTGIVFC